MYLLYNFCLYIFILDKLCVWLFQSLGQRTYGGQSQPTADYIMCLWQTKSDNINGKLEVFQYISCVLCRVGSVDSVSASRTVGREFASRTGHTKDHHKNGTNCLPA